MKNGVVKRKTLLGPALFALLVALLFGCGSGTTDPLFVPENAYGAPVPPGAATLTPAQFADRVRDGTLSIVTAGLPAQVAEQRAAAFAEHLSALESAAGTSQTVADILAGADDPEALGQEPVATFGDEPVTLLGLPELVGLIAGALETAGDVENALADYTLSYDLLSEDLQAGLPSPASLAGAGLEEVEDALAELDAALDAVVNLDNVVYAPDQGAPGQHGSMFPESDADGTCAPTNYFAEFWFPLRNFLSPVKRQGMRGTCWAFAALGAVESRERVQNDNHVDLSEQFLVNHVKLRWSPAEFEEGYGAELALHQAVDRSFQLPPESAWEFNPSLSRTEAGDKYANSCVGYAGTCSDTAHQSNQYCTLVGTTVYCAYEVQTFTGSATPASKTTQVWATGERFDLNRLRSYLANGYAIMATFPVFTGFDSPNVTGGVISNYSRDCFATNPDKSCAGHVALLVGFLSNEELSQAPLPPVNAGGGGYFVLKNSWGCGAGDGGYYYVPADYIEQAFGSLSVLNFDTRRGNDWRAEMAKPGTTEEPLLTIKATAPVPADLRVPRDVAGAFEISHSAAPRVRLTVTSNRSGVMFDGEYQYEPSGFVVPTLPLTFGIEGLHTLTLRTWYGSSEVVTGQFQVNVINSRPTIDLVLSDGPYQETGFAITALPADINEASTAGLCSRLTWTTSVAATVAGTGCSATITFHELGAARITARTTDSEGLSGTRSVDVVVQEPPANPYPVVVAASVRSRELRTVLGDTFCDSAEVTTGSTIDLRQDGCTIFGAPPPRYYAEVFVDNPSGEALTYDWTLFVTIAGSSGPEEVVLTQSIGGSEDTWSLRNNGNTNPVTSPCRVSVTVRAPEPERSKAVPVVWQGNCTYYATRVA